MALLRLARATLRRPSSTKLETLGTAPPGINLPPTVEGAGGPGCATLPGHSAGSGCETSEIALSGVRWNTRARP